MLAVLVCAPAGLLACLVLAPDRLARPRTVSDPGAGTNVDSWPEAQWMRNMAPAAVAQRVGETFVWVLVPSQTSSDPEVSWEETRVSGPDPLAVRVAKKLRNEEGS